AERASPSPQRSHGEGPPARTNDIAARAREAAGAARRGDRAGALAAIADIQRAAHDRDKEAVALDQALRNVAEALDPGKRDALSSGSPTRASDALRLLARTMASNDPAAAKDALERLNRAANGTATARERAIAAGADTRADKGAARAA